MKKLLFPWENISLSEEDLFKIVSEKYPLRLELYKYTIKNWSEVDSWKKSRDSLYNELIEIIKKK